MRFTYYYKTSDNVRHEAEISAPSRDEAFAALRDRGIRPIKVVAMDAQRDGRGSRDGGRNVLAYVLSVALVLLAAGGGVWWLAARRTAAPYQVMTPHGPITYTVAEPLPRQMIPGNRTRIEEAMGGRTTVGRDAPIAPQGASSQAADVQDTRSIGVFKFAAEAYLAQYAEPGRPVPPSTLSNLSNLSNLFKECLKEPIRIASTDFTEVVDLKRIVTGMKREMRAYLAGGGTVEQYLAELEKRQRLEISYRENAGRRLDEMIKTATEQKDKAAADGRNSRNARNAESATVGGNAYPSTELRSAYDYWLKANAQLQAMGIYPLALPDALRVYQMGLELEN